MTWKCYVSFNGINGSGVVVVVCEWVFCSVVVVWVRVLVCLGFFLTAKEDSVLRTALGLNSAIACRQNE